MLFLKFGAAIARLGLELIYDRANEKARKFYEKHGFVKADSKELFVPHTGEQRKDA